MKQNKNQRKSQKLILAIVVGIILVGGLVAYVFAQSKRSTLHPSSSPSPTPSLAQSPTPHVTVSSSPSVAPILFSIKDLGLKFMVDGSLADLEYKVVRLAGDQAVNSVAFSTKRLEAAGCGLDMAPLGVLTYDNDKGGTVVGHARNSDLYYIQPEPGCKADASLQNWKALEQSLRTVVAD